MAPVWIPNAMALAFLLRQRLSSVWVLLAAIALGNIAANLALGDGLFRSIGLAVSNVVEIGLAYTLSRRWCGAGCDMRDMRQLFFFVIAAGIIAPLSSATLAAFVLGVTGDPSMRSFLLWAASDGLGMLIVCPTLLILADALADPRKPTGNEVLVWAILTLGGTSLTLLVFTQSTYPLLFLVAPVVLSHAFFLGSIGTAFSMLKVAVIATTCTILGLGPLAQSGSPEYVQIIILQLYLATIFVMGLPVAAALRWQQQTLDTLAAREAEFGTVLENVTDAVLRYDLSAECIYASPSVIDVQGVPPEQMVGSNALERIHPESKERVQQAAEQLFTGKIDRDRFIYRRFLDDPDNEPLYIEANCGLVRDDVTGEPVEVIVSTRDVTKRVNLARQLENARRVAEDAASAKSQFLANMSHEIRTPMNGVLGYTELLLGSDLNEEQRRQVELIAESGATMMSLLSDILDISKIEAGRIVIKPQASEIRQILSACVKFHKSAAETRHIDLVCTSTPDLPELIHIDALRLRQIIHNLVGNAIKFTSSGKVEVKAKACGDRFTIDVIDSGIGIPEDRLDAIFDHFEQADNDTSRSFGGTGLGLSISRQLAELMDGTLTVESEVGEGSTFRLCLPLVRVEEMQADDPTSRSGREGNEAEFPAERILLAEDHPVNARLVQAMLEKSGQNVTHASDGIAAIEAVKTSEAEGRPYSLVLMDVQMPNCDGYEATRQLRAEGFAEQRLPIVALTANAYEEDAVTAREAGMQDHVTKPVSLETIQAILAKYLSH